MKSYIHLLLSLLMLSLISCEEKGLEIFNDGNEVYFKKYYMDEYNGSGLADSTLASFFFYPTGTQNIKASLEVCISGKLLESDIDFGLRVVEEETTADPSEYTIADKYTFHANKESKVVKESIDIDFHFSDRLSSLEDGVVLVVELVGNDNIGVGQFERRKAKIILTTKTIKPAWWTTEVEKNLLGKYSQKKYKLFLDNIDTDAQMSQQLIETRPDEARSLAFKFKNWLNEQDPKIIDEDGSEMSVTI